MVTGMTFMNVFDIYLDNFHVFWSLSFQNVVTGLVLLVKPAWWFRILFKEGRKTIWFFSKGH